MDEIRKIYENKVIPFENTDDSYKSKMSAYYSEWSSMGDKFSDVGNAIRDFLAGIGAVSYPHLWTCGEIQSYGVRISYVSQK